MFRHNSTIRIKQKACLRCGKVGPIFSKGRCQSCSTIETTLARMGQDSEKTIQDEGLQDLVATLDGLVSKYIRLKYSDKEGLCKCFTCGTSKHYTLLQAGHFIPRASMYLRFDTSRNLRPQCEHCNCILHGNLATYKEQLEIEQPGVTDILYEESNIVHKWGRTELKAMILDYTLQVKLLKK
jgi:Bacteriophage Lambda NinG protein